jgi:hypothetical protein
VVGPEPIPIDKQVDMTSVAKRVYRISADYGDVGFEDPFHYEGPLDLALMHSFGPAGLTNKNCDPFEGLAGKLWEGHEAHDLTPVLLIVPKTIGVDGITTNFDSFIAAVENAADPTFVSRLTLPAEDHPTDLPEGTREGQVSRTIALKARAARADGHMLADGGRYGQASDSPTPASHRPQVVSEIPLYVHGADAQRRAGKPPSPEPINYLSGDDPVVHVGWSKLMETIVEAYDYSDRAGFPESKHEYAACQLAINAGVMLEDSGFSEEQIRHKSRRLARHIENMHTLNRMLSTLEHAEAQ